MPTDARSARHADTRHARKSPRPPAKAPARLAHRRRFPQGHRRRPRRRQGRPAAAKFDARAKASVAKLIADQIRPCALRQRELGPGANRIQVTLNLQLSPSGRLKRSPTVVRVTGDDERQCPIRRPGRQPGDRLLPPMLAAPPSGRALPDAPGRLGQHQHEIPGAMMRLMLKDHPRPQCCWPPRPRRRNRRRSRSTSSAAASNRRSPSPCPPCPRPVAPATGSAGRSPRSSRPTCARPACSRRSGPGGIGSYSYAQASAPLTPNGAAPAPRPWSRGYVEQRGDGRLTARLLRPRRHRRPAAGQPGLHRRRRRLAPRRAQMRRPRLFAAVGPRRLSRHPRRLCRRNRAQDPPHEAHRHHGFGRLQPPLSDRRARRR